MQGRRRVYIAGPILKGPLDHNIRQSEQAFYALADAGLAPFCPHWSCYATGPRVGEDGTVYAVAAREPGDRPVADWYEIDLAWVAASAAVLRLPGEGVGSDAEVAYAKSLRIPVFYSVEHVIAWAKEQDAVDAAFGTAA
jgi:hypothetical protein